MGTGYMVMDQGSTLAWTHGYGSAPVWREKLRDVAFALAVLVFVSGVAGFVAG